MRHSKRLLLFAGEASVLLVGFVLSGVLAVLIHPWLGEKVFWLGVLATTVGFFALRQKHRDWKIEYDAEGWRASRAERKLHPIRARYKRTARRILIWVPSAIAAFVLFFFPALSHLLQPHAQYLTHYHVAVPWSFTIWRLDWPDSLFAYGTSSGRGRFGLTPYWGREYRFSLMTFESLDRDSVNYRYLRSETQRQGASQVLRREFRLGDVPLVCWQFKPAPKWKPVWLYGVSQVWEVDCEMTASDVPSFSAWFYGGEDDLSGFYQIVQSAYRSTK
jgi:hypothetical protein